MNLTKVYPSRFCVCVGEGDTDTLSIQFQDARLIQIRTNSIGGFVSSSIDYQKKQILGFKGPLFISI